MVRRFITVSTVAVFTALAISTINPEQVYAAPGNSGNNASGNGGGLGGSADAGRSSESPGLGGSSTGFGGSAGAGRSSSAPPFAGTPTIGNGVNGQAGLSANGIFNGVLHANRTALLEASTTSLIGAFGQVYSAYLDDALTTDDDAIRAIDIAEMANLLSQYANVEITPELINAINKKLFDAQIITNDPEADATLTDEIAESL